MIINCTGVAIIEDNLSGRRFEIHSDELDWKVAAVQNRSMGMATHYRASIEHKILGTLSWSLWEYPVGLQNYNSTEVGQGRIIKDFDYSLEYEDEQVWEVMLDLPYEDEQVWEDMLDLSEAISSEELARFSEDEQIEHMVTWFNNMFEDPQNKTPFAIDKDSPYNYEYIWGGPYEAVDELANQFAGIVREETIDKAVEIIEKDGIIEWAPGDAHPDMRNEEAMADYAEEAHQASSLEEVRQQINKVPELHFGTSEELAARRKLLELIQELGPLVVQTVEAPVHGGIGHNQPPPEMVVPKNTGISIIANINIIQIEVSSDAPNAEKVVDAASTLQKVRDEVSDFFHMTKDQVKNLGSKALATAIILGIGTLVGLVINWISAALGLPFF